MAGAHARAEGGAGTVQEAAGDDVAVEVDVRGRSDLAVLIIAPMNAEGLFRGALDQARCMGRRRRTLPSSDGIQQVTRCTRSSLVTSKTDRGWSSHSIQAENPRWVIMGGMQLQNGSSCQRSLCHRPRGGVRSNAQGFQTPGTIAADEKGGRRSWPEDCASSMLESTGGRTREAL